jgi:hypothetical protein
MVVVLYLSVAINGGVPRLAQQRTAKKADVADRRRCLST